MTHPLIPQLREVEDGVAHPNSPIPQLPVELGTLVLSFMCPGTLRALALVSHAYWAYATPHLWKRLPSGTILLSLLSEKPVTKMDTQDYHRLWDDIHIWGEDELYLLPQAIQSERLERFQAHAPFVRTLSLDDPVLMHGHREFLLRQQQPLLPNLETLIVSADGEHDGEYGWGSQGQCTLTSEHLVMLFLSASVKTVAICSRCVSGIDWADVVARAPRVHDLRLGSYYGINTLDVESTKRRNGRLDYTEGKPMPREENFSFLRGSVDPASCALALSSWNYLSSLTVQGQMFANVLLPYFQPLTSLRHLKIVAPDASDDWVPSSRLVDLLPALRRLDILEAGPQVAEMVFNCGFLLRNVTCLCWDSKPDDLADASTYLGASQALVHQMPSLQVLTLRLSTITACQVVVGAAGQLALVELGVSLFAETVLEEAGAVALFASGRATLQELRIQNIAIPPAALPPIMAAYPRMSRLQAVLNGAHVPQGLQIGNLFAFAPPQVELQLTVAETSGN